MIRTDFRIRRARDDGADEHVAELGLRKLEASNEMMELARRVEGVQEDLRPDGMNRE